MIKRVKSLGSEFVPALINNESVRSYLESFESELSRGISTLCVLRIIKNSGQSGIYGYQLLKELELQSNSMLVLEEGRLYPFLKKLEQWGPNEKRISLIAVRKEESGRKRKFYHLTEDGKIILNHLEGFFSKLMESISPMLSMKVDLLNDQYLFCPNCANRINLSENIQYCAMCGLDVQNFRKQQFDGGINLE